MARRKLNVLVYTGTGTTVESVKHCMYSLRRLLSPNYAVIPVSESVIIKEPWAPTCVLLVFPGGADLGYCRVLNGAGNRRIRDFVRRGGSYLGLCAGGYYGSRVCEFEVGNRSLEVVGSRELAFFPGTCRGGAFRGFEYHSEKGARAVRLNIAQGAFPENAPAATTSYYDGGGVFVDAAKEKDVEVLATYEQDLDVVGGDSNAAVVLCNVEKGKAILSGPHPEFAPLNLNPQPDIAGYSQLVDKLTEEDETRTEFLRLCLIKLGLEVGKDTGALPSLSTLHLSSADHANVTELLCAWEEVMDKVDGEEFIKAEADTFHIQNEETCWAFDEMRQSLEPTKESTQKGNGVVDFNAITKRIVPHEKALPNIKLTPNFNHNLFYSSLKRYQLFERDAEEWGNVLLYGDVVTSTNSLLDKNPKLTSKLPTGFTFAATTQVAGRGRGSNVWLAPPGSLIFSTVINHPAYLAASRPIVFIQYIAAVAIVEAIHSYDQGYEKLPVKLKWPNDIYALDPTKPEGSGAYVKIGGILSQCGYSDGAYQIVLGIGINAINPRPTTSLSDLLPASISPLHIETLLARVLTRLEGIYAQFRREGFSADLEERYYRHWLHTGQSITVKEDLGDVKARVLGITRDWGMLKVEETDREGRGTGRVWGLQSDENSFDYWEGLIKRKV